MPPTDACGRSVTLIATVELMPAAVAVTLATPVAPTPAVKRPAAVTVPSVAGVTDHDTGMLSGSSNWSFTAAVAWVEAPVYTNVFAALAVIIVGAGVVLTVALTPS